MAEESDEDLPKGDDQQKGGEVLQKGGDDQQSDGVQKGGVLEQEQEGDEVDDFDRKDDDEVIVSIFFSRFSFGLEKMQVEEEEEEAPPSPTAPSSNKAPENVGAIVIQKGDKLQQKECDDQHNDDELVEAK